MVILTRESEFKLILCTDVLKIAFAHAVGVGGNARGFAVDDEFCGGVGDGLFVFEVNYGERNNAFAGFQEQCAVVFALEDSCYVRLDCVAEIALFLGVDGNVAALANAVDCDISGGVGGEVFGVAFNDYFNIRPCKWLIVILINDFENQISPVEVYADVVG
ncbi:MAG: hypothetical protein IKM79_00775 [Bacteroidales bacterium]|nr:hypothetical protein [Bacteroidales bacterium]